VPGKPQKPRKTTTKKRKKTVRKKLQHISLGARRTWEGFPDGGREPTFRLIHEKPHIARFNNQVPKHTIQHKYEILAETARKACGKLGSSSQPSGPVDN